MEQTIGMEEEEGVEVSLYNSESWGERRIHSIDFHQVWVKRRKKCKFWANKTKLNSRFLSGPPQVKKKNLTMTFLTLLEVLPPELSRDRNRLHQKKIFIFLGLLLIHSCFGALSGGPYPILQRSFFTPIPCTYTSSPLDGIARNYCYFYLHGYTRSCNFCVWIHFVPTSLYPRRWKTFGLSWNWTQALLLHKQPL